MALKSTIYKAELQIADMNRHYYADHTLTLARHPSETDERMMVRLVAFALNAHEYLQFGKGLSDVDDPDLALRDLTGVIEHWIEVGHPDERAILKACGRGRLMSVYAYSSRAESIWWQPIAAKLARARNLAVFAIPSESSVALAKMAERNMRLALAVQDEEITLSSPKDAVSFTLQVLRARE